MEISETFSLIFGATVLIVVIGLFVRICIRLRKGGGSLTTIGLGATWEFMTKDRKRATETILNMNAGKKHEDPHVKDSK